MSHDRKTLTGKADFSLLPWGALKEVVAAFECGNTKYGRGTWRLRNDGSRNAYFAACQRHLIAWFEGEGKDPESGHSHLGHAVACLLILITHEQDEAKERGSP